MKLRLALIICAGWAILLGALIGFNFAPNLNPILGIYIAFQGLVVLIALLFERHTYLVSHPLPSEGWVLTKERFIDPLTNKTMEVYYHPATGQRQYQEAKTQHLAKPS